MVERLFGLRRGDSFASVLERNRGVGPGFDILRIGLAILIAIGHAKWISGAESLGKLPMAINYAVIAADAGAGAWNGWTRPLKMALVPAFFALSGFLVTGSALRSRQISTFLAHRILRIFPALVVEVLLSAFVLGAVLTTLPLDVYFQHPVMHRYLLNMVGEVSFYLPGVFETNRATAMVNANLWTLPAELGCYIIVTVLMLTKIMYDRRLVLLAVILTTIILATLHFMYGISNTSIYYLPHVIIYYFVLGMAFYHWKEYFPTNPFIVPPVLFLTYLLLMSNRYIYLAAPLLTWLTLWAGMIGFPRSKILSSGDYSYGVYLYGFPISQAMIATMPWLYGNSIIFIILSLGGTCLFAVFSWHVVEKNVLRLKRNLPVRWFPLPSNAGVPAS